MRRPVAKVVRRRFHWRMKRHLPDFKKMDRRKEKEYYKPNLYRWCFNDNLYYFVYLLIPKEEEFGVRVGWNGRARPPYWERHYADGLDFYNDPDVIINRSAGFINLYRLIDPEKRIHGAWYVKRGYGLTWVRYGLEKAYREAIRGEYEEIEVAVQLAKELVDEAFQYLVTVGFEFFRKVAEVRGYEWRSPLKNWPEGE